MNLRPLVLGLSLVACVSQCALAQQIAPGEAGGDDLGFTPAQMADFAGQPSVAFAAGQEPAASITSQRVVPAAMTGPPQFMGPQTVMAGYQSPPAGPANPPQAFQQNSPDAQLAPNWANPNNVQLVMPGAPTAGVSGPGFVPQGPGPGVDPYGGAYPSGLPPVGEPARPRWYFRADSVWLPRDRPTNHNLTSYDNLDTPADRLNNHFLLRT